MREYGGEEVKEKFLTKVLSVEVVPTIKILGMLGTGEKNDPVCTGVQYWDFNGNKLATLGRIKEQEPIDSSIHTE